MKIKGLKINSFRGLQNLEFENFENINVFCGENQLGKTTVIDSIMWVLCDETLVNGKQDSDNRNMLNLKQPLNVIVEMDNGLILERRYKDIWVEDEDGQLRYSRTDNQFYINGAKYKKEEYFEFIKDSLGLNRLVKTKDFNLLRSLIDYNYYSNIDYKIARKFTEELMDLKSDVELLSQEQFKDIKIDMQVLKFDTGKCASKYKTEFDKVDLQIKEKQTVIADLEKTFSDDEIAKGEKLYEERKTLLNDNISLNDDYKAIERLLEENSINIQVEKENTLKAKNELEKEKNDLILKGNQCNSNIQLCENEIKNKNREKEDLIFNNGYNEKQILKNKEMKFEVKTCPHCNGILNEKQKNEFEEHIKNLQDNFNKIIDDNNSKIEKIEFEIKSYENKKQTNIDDLGKYRKDYIECEKKIKKLEEEINNNSKVNELLLKKEELIVKKNEFINNYNTKRNEKISILTTKIDKCTIMLNNKKYVEQLKVEIQDLKKKKAYLDMQRELVKDFKDLKRNMIKENTNKVFPNINIEIIEENENTGATKDVCYATLKGVEYKAINDGHRYLVGITIIEDIKRALGLEDLPIVFDKFADIDKNTLKEIRKVTNAQIFTTLVSDEKTITLKKENN